MESPKVQKRPIKPHGFKCPLHILQCLSWLVISYTIVVSYTLVLPLLERALSIVFAVCLSLSELVMVVLWFLATIVDPTDLMVYGKKEEDASSEYRAFCSMCNCTVSLSSKHCGQCNRCVDNFDHHCKWLNNCIGRRNYCLFIALIITLEVASCVVAAFTSLLLANVALDSEFESRLSDVYSYEHVNGIIILLAVLLVANTCILVANGQLIYLHIWLKMKKMTTYQYLMLRRSKRKVKHGLEQPATEEFADIAQSERQGAESPREEIEQVNNSVRKISPSPEMKTRTMMSKSVTIVPTSHLTEGTGAEEEFPSLGREEESM